MNDKLPSVLWRIALSSDKKRWRIEGDKKQYLADKVYIRTKLVETENGEERKLLSHDKDYTGPFFVIKTRGKLIEKTVEGKKLIYII